MSILNFSENLSILSDLQILFPEYCEACNENLSTLAGFCQPCLTNIVFFDESGSCPVCAEKLPADKKCAVCSTRHIFFHKAKFLYDYSGTSRNLITSAKFKRRKRCMNLIKKHLAEKVNFISVLPVNILPVPSSHELTNEIAEYIAAQTKMPLVNLLKRKKARKTKTLSRHQRFSEIEDSYEITDLSPVLKFEKVLIIDDIFTTGATINFIAKLLHEKLGITENNIEVFALARRTRSGINTEPDEDSSAI